MVIKLPQVSVSLIFAHFCSNRAIANSSFFLLSFKLLCFNSKALYCSSSTMSWVIFLFGGFSLTSLIVFLQEAVSSTTLVTASCLLINSSGFSATELGVSSAILFSLGLDGHQPRFEESSCSPSKMAQILTKKLHRWRSWRNWSATECFDGNTQNAKQHSGAYDAIIFSKKISFFFKNFEAINVLLRVGSDYGKFLLASFVLFGNTFCLSRSSVPELLNWNRMLLASNGYL